MECEVVGQSEGLILLPYKDDKDECRLMACSCCVVMMMSLCRWPGKEGLIRPGPTSGKTTTIYYTQLLGF
jgi:hypothetical protein